VPVGVTGIEDFVRAMAVAPPDSRSRLYWTARVSLVRKHSELAVFDSVFEAVFGTAVLDLNPHAQRTPLASQPAVDDRFSSIPGTSGDEQAGSGVPWVTLPPAVSGAEDSDSTIAMPERLPSEVAGLADVPFEQLGDRDMQLLGQWLASAVRRWPTRRSRRLAIDASGHRIAVRPTVARSRSTGWEPIDLVHVKAVAKPRRVVMLCDVSQSMQAQAVAYFHLMRALALSADAEVFAFGTTLTRLTTVLAHKSTEVAIEQATAKVVDRFGGTRIASSLQTLLRSHHAGTLRGAIVIIASDGWDSDSPDELATAMARVRRRAYRVIWINPRASARGYEPRVATMAAALPYCDAFLPANDFRSLAAVITEISSCVSSTASRGSRAGTDRR
jgi:uncharacterized protein with von Willebrand factor type A (vWA) domain